MAIARSAWILALLAPGCILYQERRVGCEKCGDSGVTDTAWVSIPATTDPTEPTGPKDPPPADSGDDSAPGDTGAGHDPASYALAPAEACPGDLLLARLEGPGAVSARFDRAVTVRDDAPDPTGVDLLLEVGADAAAGEVGVTVRLSGGGTVALPGGFLVRDDCGG